MRSGLSMALTSRSGVCAGLGGCCIILYFETMLTHVLLVQSGPAPEPDPARVPAGRRVAR